MGTNRMLQLALLLAMATCGGNDEKMGCQDDFDCREPRICVQGFCENPGGDGKGCDGSDLEQRLCSCWFEACPDSPPVEEFMQELAREGFTLEDCNSGVASDMKCWRTSGTGCSNDSLFFYCLGRERFCHDPVHENDSLFGECDPGVQACMESFGFVDCAKDGECGAGQTCVDSWCC